MTDLPTNSGSAPSILPNLTKANNPSLGIGDKKIFDEKFGAAMDNLDSPKAQIEALHHKEQKTAVAQIVMIVSLLIPLAAWVAFQTILNADSAFSNVLRAHNYGKDFVQTTELKQEKQRELTLLKTKTKKIKKDIVNIQNNKILTDVTENRIDYIAVMAHLNSVLLKSLNLTEKEHLAPEINMALGRLTMQSFSGNIDKNGEIKLSVNGSVRDAKQRSFTRVTKIIDTLNADAYFNGAALRSFSKSEDDDGGMQSTFSLSFDYIRPEMKAENDQTTISN